MRSLREAASRAATLVPMEAEGAADRKAAGVERHTNLGYDQGNRLTGWGQGSTTTATYTYNADGLRMQDRLRRDHALHLGPQRECSPSSATAPPNRSTAPAGFLSRDPAVVSFGQPL